MSGKGSKQRPTDHNAYSSNYDIAFGKKLNEVGGWMDEDKDYSIGTQEKYDEFVAKRNESLNTPWSWTVRELMK